MDAVLPETNALVDTIRSDIKRKGIYHPPVYAVTVAYPKSSFLDVELDNEFGNLQNLPGFGSLNPRSEGVRTLGTLWSSSLFPGRCPPDYNLLLNYIGGSRDVGIAGLSEEEVISEVDKGCRQVLLKPDAPPPEVMGLKLWPTAIPQYELGHLEIIKELEEAEKNCPGLWISGNYRTGVAFPDCVTYGYEHAKVVKKFLDEQKQPVEVVAKADKVEAKTETKTEAKKPSTETKTESMPEAKTEPKAEVKVEAKAEPKTEVKPKAKAEAKAEAKTDSKPEIKAEAKAEAKTEPKTEIKPEAKAKSKPGAATDSKSEAKPEIKAEAKTKSKPEVKAKSKPEIKAEAKAKSKSAAKTEEKSESAVAGK
jgi:hypothetical protein